MPILKNPRHEQFAAFVAAGKSATDAYVSVGFSAGRDGNTKRGAAQSASRLRRNPLVSARIAELVSELQQSRSSKAWLDREFVIEGLKRNFERAMQAEPVLDSGGKPTGEFRYSGSVATRCLELLGKELGMFTDRVMQVKDLSEWSADDWTRAINDYASKIGVPVAELEKAVDEYEAKQDPGDASDQVN